jgi:hypothetical protein
LEDYQSAVVIVLSKAFYEENYGLEFTVKDDQVNLSDIAELLCGENCKKLLGRPKIFFLLAESVVPPISTDNCNSKKKVFIFCQLNYFFESPADDSMQLL